MKQICVMLSAEDENPWPLDPPPVVDVVAVRGVRMVRRSAELQHSYAFHRLTGMWAS